MSGPPWRTCLPIACPGCCMRKPSGIRRRWTRCSSSTAGRRRRDYFAMDVTRVVENPSRLAGRGVSPPGWAPRPTQALASGQVDQWGVLVAAGYSASFRPHRVAAEKRPGDPAIRALPLARPGGAVSLRGRPPPGGGLARAGLCGGRLCRLDLRAGLVRAGHAATAGRHVPGPAAGRLALGADGGLPAPTPPGSSPGPTWTS